MKKISTLFLAVALIASISSISVFAAYDATTSQLKNVSESKNSELPDSTVKEIAKIFSNEGYTILDKKGNDVTKEFVEYYQDSYVNGEIKFIMAGLISKNLVIAGPVVYTDNKNVSQSSLNSVISPTRLILSHTATQTFSVPVEGSYLVTITVAGDYRTYDSTGLIESASNPRVISHSTNLSVKGYSYQVFSNGVYADINTSRTQVSFVYNAKVEVFVKTGMGWIDTFFGTTTFYANA